MLIKRFLVLALILAIVLPSVSSGYYVSSDNNTISFDKETLDSHLIEDVPYAGQYYNLHCSYASRTMCIKHLGINVSLEDILFHSGLAYSMGYPFDMPSFDMSLKYMPMGGYIISQDSKDISHLASIYGFKSNEWAMYINESETGWKTYLQRVKENISADIPIVTSVSPLKLSSFRNFFNFNEKIWNLAPDGGHAVVVVGYNDNNNSICYNDPAALFFGDPNKGTYVWMDQNSFLDAVNSSAVDAYLIRSITKISEPIEEKLAFSISHKRNIERLKGNISAYANYSEEENIDYNFGINAVNELKNVYNDTEEQRDIIKIYKKNGAQTKMYKLGSLIISLLFDGPDRLEEMLIQDEFEKTAIERTIAANYLRNNSHLSDKCIYDAELLEQEAEKWMDLSKVYSKFMKRGYFIFLPLATMLLKNMVEILDEIITIEQAIIDGTIES